MATDFEYHSLSCPNCGKNVFRIVQSYIVQLVVKLGGVVSVPVRKDDMSFECVNCGKFLFTMGGENSPYKKIARLSARESLSPGFARTAPSARWGCDRFGLWGWMRWGCNEIGDVLGIWIGRG